MKPRKKPEPPSVPTHLISDPDIDPDLTPWEGPVPTLNRHARSYQFLDLVLTLETAKAYAKQHETRVFLVQRVHSGKYQVFTQKTLENPLHNPKDDPVKIVLKIDPP